MPLPLPALSLGHGLELWRPRVGVVHSRFDSALNLLVEGELWTLLARSRTDAPFGIRVDAGPSLPPVSAGADVRVRAGMLKIGDLVVDARAATRWVPVPWAPAAGFAARLDAVERRARPHAWQGSAGLAHAVMAALAAPAGGRALADAVGRTVGRGPGFTPAGDDLLVGALAVFAAASADAAGAEARARLAQSLWPSLTATAVVSAQLLRQAARGFVARALHELGVAVFAAAPGARLGAAIDALLATGHTSGADSCLGFVAACRYLFSHRAPARAAA